MNAKFSFKTGLFLTLSLTLVLAALLQASPALAGIGTSPTIDLSYTSGWKGLEKPITIIAGLGTSPTTPLKGAYLYVYVDGKLIGLGITDASGSMTLVYDPSGLSLGSHTFEVRFPAATINGIAYCGSSASTTFVVK